MDEIPGTSGMMVVTDLAGPWTCFLLLGVQFGRQLLN
jgi:hypothetical protein